MRGCISWLRRAGAALGSLLLVPVVFAQGSFPTPEALPDVRLEVAGTVNAIVRYDDGGTIRYFIGGQFDFVNGAPRRNLARLDANGRLDVAWRADTDGAVNALALAGDRLYVGGAFAFVDGAAHARLARVDADDGDVVAAWSPDANGTVNALQTDGDSVWAGGVFTSIDGVPVRMVARIDAIDGSLPTFAANFAGSSVLALLHDAAAGELYIGGVGKVKSPQNQRALMKVAAGNGAAIAWNPSIGPQGGSQVRALAADATSVYAVGRLRRVGNQTRGNGARFLKTSGATLQAWNPAADAEIRALALDAATGSVHVGGDFLALSGRQRLARTDATSGAAVAGFAANADRAVNALLVDGDQLLMGGGFSRLGASAAQGGLARLSTLDGALDFSFIGDAAGRGSVGAYAFDAAGGVILGGRFDAVRQDGELLLYPRQNVARLLPSTFELDRTWAVNVSGEVNAVAIGGNDLFLGGNFTTVQGAARTRLARLEADSGTLDAAWLPTADAPVRSLAVDAGRLYVAGDFTLLGGAPRSGLGRVATSGAGAVDAGWDPAPDDVVDVVLPSGAGVWLGGAFANVGGQSRVGLARIDATTGAADAFVADVDAAGAVHALLETSDGLYVGGRFGTLGGQNRNGIGRIGAGGVDGWHPDVADGDVHAIAYDAAAAQVYLGGAFATAGGSAHPNLARASSALPGAVDPAWRPGTDAAVVQLAVPAEGVLAAGAFTLATDVMRNGIAMFGRQGSDTTSIEIDSVTPVGGSSGANTVFGQDYVVGWTLANESSGDMPTGSVIVTASTGESCGPVAAFAGGCTLTPTSTGPRTLTAAFTGDAQFLDATSPPFAHAVDPATLLLTLTTAPYPSANGATPDALITALVPSPGAANPAGTVVVTLDGGPGCSIVLPAASCSLPAPLGFGFYDLLATYVDDFAAPHHAATPVAFEHAVGTLTSVALTVPATALVNTPVIASVVTTNVPDGSTVGVSGGSGCSITVNGGVGSCPLMFTNAGTTQVTAAYAGDGTLLLPSQDGAAVAVDTLATMLEVSIAPESPFAGAAVTIDIVTNLPPGAVVTLGGAPGCNQIVLPDLDCIASFPAAGPVTVTADFPGDLQFGPASATDDATVQLNATTLAVQLAPATPVVGQQVAVSITTNLPNGSAVAITGAPGCTAIVLPATGCTTTYGAPVVAAVSASFAGSAQFGAASDAAGVTVGKAATAFVEFVATPSLGVPDDSIAFVWDVRVAAPGAGTPTGSVRVSVGGDGTTPSCTAPVAAGTCSIVFPDEGVFAMHADYAGDSNLQASLSTVADVSILSGAPTEADLQIGKVVGRSQFASGSEQVEFMLVVANAGPASAIGVAISDAVPTGMSAAVWTCAPDDGGASCSAPNGSGAVDVQANLAAGSSVTILFRGDVVNPPFDGILNTASIVAPLNLNDPVPANNASTTRYQRCPSSAGAALVEHFCLFRNGLEQLQP